MRKPNRFVSLHNHDGSSTYDGLGPVEEHLKFAFENGLDAHAITNHGHMNSYAAGQLFYESWQKEGRKFKFIPGVEAYVHPDLREWQKVRETEQAKKEAAKRGEKLEELDFDMNNQLTVENEEATKQGKYRNPLNRRHHLVMLPKNSEGLKKIFSMVSYGYLDGFYRFPRVDLPTAKKIIGDTDSVIVSSACIGGPMAYEVFGHFENVQFDDLGPKLLQDETMVQKVLNSIANEFDKYADAFGVHNVHLELQFNKLGAQHLINHALIRFAKERSLTDQLIVTCDAHYPRPELWKHREMYKKLGYLNYKDYGPDSLPKSKDDIKAELYPKNADQMWAEYISNKEDHPEYEGMDDIICDAIERTHDIAHTVIGDIPADRTPKFPQKLIPKDKTAFEELVFWCKKGLKLRGKSEDQKYIDRMMEELRVIRKLEISEYFVTLRRIMELARQKVLVGPCRGSGGGSLVCYCLYITDVDPVKYDLYFSRFISVYRSGMPDVDIDVSDRDTVLDLLREEFGDTNVVPISNYNLMKLKSLVKDISKFYGIPFEEVNNATKTVEHDVRKATLKDGDDKNLFVLEFEPAMKHSPSFRAFIEKHPEVAESIQILFKEQRSLGRHAGGILVMDDLRNKMPLITSGGEPQSPWVEGMAVKHLEKIGNFIKYDLLGLETLRLLQRTIELILEKHGVYEITLENETHRLAGNQRVLLESGKQKSVSELTETDNIVSPLIVS